MNECIAIKSEQFDLSLNFRVFDSDIQYGSNTILSVCVSSSGFSATATMDIDIKRLPFFCNELKNVYDSLNGKARLQEAFGDQYIEFCGDGKGHIGIAGQLESNGSDGFSQKLQFENRIDQTFLPAFLASLNSLANHYVK